MKSDKGWQDTRRDSMHCPAGRATQSDSKLECLPARRLNTTVIADIRLEEEGTSLPDCCHCSALPWRFPLVVPRRIIPLHPVTQSSLALPQRGSGAFATYRHDKQRDLLVTGTEALSMTYSERYKGLRPPIMLQYCCFFSP